MDKPQSAAPPRSTPLTPLFTRGETFVSLSLPQFRFLLVGTGLSQIATWMEEVARGWLVLQLTGSALQLGLLGFIRGISQLLFSPLAGVLADRLERRWLATITQSVSAVQALTIALLVSADLIAVWQLYGLVVIGGAMGAVNVPTRQVLVYDTVGGRHIANAIALNSITANLSRVIAPAVGGAVIGSVSIGASYYVQTIFFLLATGATFLLRPLRRAEPIREPMWQAIRAGLRYVRGDPRVLRLVLLNCIPNLLIYPYVSMMPVFAQDVLHVGSEGYGILLTAAGFGAIPGGLIVANMSDSPRKGRTMGLAALLYMGMVTLFALSSIFYLSFAILVVAGIGWSMMVTLNQTLLQMNLSDSYRGRVMSLYTMAGGLTPFGNISMGAAADGLGVQTAVVAFALAGLACSAVLGLGSARVRRL